jgi:ATP-dependent helicase/DNAse subunit B
VRKETTELSLIETIKQWRESHTQGTVIFPSPILLKAWEEQLLKELGWLGGVKFTLFSGITEDLIGTQDSFLVLHGGDSQLLAWGAMQVTTDETMKVKPDEDWRAVGITQVIADIFRQLNQTGIDCNIIKQMDNICPQPLVDGYASYYESIINLGLMDSEMLLTEAAKIIKASERLPSFLKHVIVFGFDELSAAQGELISELSKKGEVIFISISGSNWIEDDSILAKLISDNQDRKISGLIGCNREWEVRGIARKILQYSASGISFQSIAVIFRNLNLYMPIIGRVFKEYEIPINRDESLSLPSHPAIKVFNQLLRTIESGGNCSEMTRLLSLRFNGTVGRIVDSHLMTDNKSVGSFTLSKWCGWLDTIGTEVEEINKKRLYTLIKWLNLDLPEDLLSFFNMCCEWLAEFDDYLDCQDEDGLLLWKTQYELSCLLERWRRLIKSAGYQGQNISPSEFRILLENLLNTSNISRSSGKTNGVVLSTPTEINGVSFDRIFLGGLIEGDFPRISNDNNLVADIVFSQLGILTQKGEDILRRERRLFGQVMLAAKEELVISYPETDAEGRPYTPSTYWRGLEKVLAENNCERISHKNRWELPPVSHREMLDIAAYHYSQLSSDNLTERYQVEFLRRKGEKKYSGGLYGNKTISRGLAYEFGPNYPFSVSALEDYARCPFAFFCRRVLKIKILDERYTSLAPPNEIGILLHELLRDFMQNHAGELLCSEHTEQYFKEIDSLLDNIGCTEEFGETGVVEDSKVLQLLQRGALRKTLYYYIEDEINWAKKIGGRFAPTLFEQGFNMVVPGIEGEDNNIRLVGKVDRVDIGREGDRFILFDYKSARVPTRKEQENGLDLQLLIYLKALENMLDFKGIGAGYYNLFRRERTSGIWRKSWNEETGMRLRILDDNEWEGLFQQLSEWIREYVNGIRQGVFHPTAQECPKYCKYRGICRRGLTGGEENEAE